MLNINKFSVFNKEIQDYKEEKLKPRDHFGILDNFEKKKSK